MSTGEPLGSIPAETIGFETERLVVEPWHRGAERAGVDLAEIVSELLTPVTTVSLPEPWRGRYPLDRARGWVVERDAESPTLLVTDRSPRRPAGLVILFAGDRTGPDPGPDRTPAGADRSGLDIRIGYVLAEAVWGQGMASELVAGLAAWARSTTAVASLTAGVEAANAASIRVLVKNGFVELGSRVGEGRTYRLQVRGHGSDVPASPSGRRSETGPECH